MADEAAVALLLGRVPAGEYRVVVRTADGAPVVIENAPHLRDGTPMPTRYWLVDRRLVEAVSRLEAAGGVHRFESLVDADDLAACHAAYAAARDRAITRVGRPAPTGGVGGTRRGVKCLHAHLAYHLAGGTDPVGALVAEAVGGPALVREDAP